VQPTAVPERRRSSFVGDLRAVLAERRFRRLFATRLVSQTGDGVFNAGLAAYVFFSAGSFPNPTAAVSAFAVLYLPYSLLGPFAGVFIDRWSRRQILVWSALIRAALVALTALLVAEGTLGVPLYVCAIAVLGVNRFFLSSLSAALPHVISQDKLVMANSVGPTSGTIAGFIGGVAGLGVHLATGGGHVGSAATLLAGGACYAAAGLTGATMPRDLLGPNNGEAQARTTASVLADLVTVTHDLTAGARYAWRQRPAAAALCATGVQRLCYGVPLLMSILLYRNYFYHQSSSNNALGHFTLVVIASAFGYFAAAILTPQVTRRLSKAAWITILLAAGGLLAGTLGPTFSQVPFLVLGFMLGIVAQGVSICATTIIQEQVDDAYLGRVFSFYDMFFNVATVAGAAVAAPFLPLTGKSYPLIAVDAAVYLLGAAGYSLLGRGSSPASGGESAAPASGGEAPSPLGASPSASAQRSSS
jgi:MFS family permease